MTEAEGSAPRFARAGPEGPAGAVRPLMVADDLWVDAGASPIPIPAEAAGLLVAGAVVSLHSVLGEAGVLPRPSRIVTSVADVPTTRPGEAMRVAGPFGEYLFRSMPAELVSAGTPDDRLDAGPAWAGPYAHARATPEKAICDWLWVSGLPGGPGEPPLDCDLDDVDMDRLARLADAMDVGSTLEAWLSRIAAFQSDDEHGEQFGSRFSF